MNDTQPLGRSPTGETNIEKTVMRRVRLIRILALIISTATFAILAFMAALWGIGREVWVARVLENMPSTGNLLELSRFWLLAFLNTGIIVQALIILTLASLFFLAREIVRTAVSYFNKSDPTR
jgi:hypothetical protein